MSIYQYKKRIRKIKMPNDQQIVHKTSLYVIPLQPLLIDKNSRFYTPPKASGQPACRTFSALILVSTHGEPTELAIVHGHQFSPAFNT